MWPRIALWVAGFLVVPVVKYVWARVLESPSYLKEVEKINAERTAKEQAKKEELERFRSQISSTGREAHHKYFRGLVDEENSN